MSKLSKPVAKALQALLKASRGDVMVVTRTITGNFSAEEYFHNLKDEIGLLRCAPFNDILIALVEGLPEAIKTTEQPSTAAAVEGILTEEELKDIESNYGFYNAILLKVIASHRNLLSANAELSFKNMKLKEICKKSFNFVDAMENFMGDNLQVVGWHQNGDFEPLDNFISENIDSNLWQDLKAITSEVKS